MLCEVLIHKKIKATALLEDVRGVSAYSVAKSCMTLCDPIDYSLPGSCVHEIFQARILEWVAMPSSRGSSKPRDGTHVSCVVDKFFTCWAMVETLYICVCVCVCVCVYICIYSLPWWLSGKESTCNAGDTGLILGWEDPLEKEMATHSSILTWEIPWREKPEGLQSMESKESDMT